MKGEIHDLLTAGRSAAEGLDGSLRVPVSTDDLILAGEDPAAIEPFLADRAEELSVVLGQPFHQMTLTQALEDCERLISQGDFYHVVTANTDFLAQCRMNTAAAKVLRAADRVYCDGMPLVWASRFLAKPLPERVAGSDLTPKLLQLCSERGWRVFLFGSDEETMVKLRDVLPQQYPGLQIAGAIAPPYGDIEGWDNEAYLDQIREAEPHVFFSAMGFPKQDVWIQRYLKPSVATLAIGVGASLDFLVGKQVRAPRWMQSCGLEWFWRMAGDPGRLVKRYAGDFWALGCLLARELPFFLWRARSGRYAPVANGIGGSVERIAVCDGCDWKALHRQVTQSGRMVMILDCAELHAPALPICSELVALAKAAGQRGKVAAVYGGGKRLGAYLAKIGMEDRLPVFEHPLALEAWAGKQTSVFAGRTWTLKVPSNLTDGRVKEFRGCVGEVARWVRAEGETLRLCLNEVNRASLMAMLQLTRWCEEFEGRSRLISLSGGSEQLRETFRIIGLENYLEDAPLPLDGTGGSMVAANPQRGEMAMPSSEEDEEVVLGGESLWD